MKKILIIEDSEDQIEMFAEIFSRDFPNIELTFARTSSEASDQLDKSRFDLIIADILIPGGKTGLDVISENMNLGDTPTIIVSGLGTDNMIQRARLLGAVEYIEKPIDFGQLSSLIKAMLINYR